MLAITIKQQDPTFVIELDYDHATSLLEELNRIDWSDINGFDSRTREFLRVAYEAANSPVEPVTITDDDVSSAFKEIED